MRQGTPLFISGGTRSRALWLTDRIGCQPHVSPIYDADFVAQLLWIFMVHTGEERKRLVARCMVDTVRRLETKAPRSSLSHGGRHIHLDRRAISTRTDELLNQLDCGMGILALREYISDLFAHHCAIDDKPRWACSSALLVHMLPQLHSLFPEMRIVHVAAPRENPLAAAESFAAQFPGQYARIEQNDLRWTADEVVESILSWSSTVNPRPVGASRRQMAA